MDERTRGFLTVKDVPNAPCGVERQTHFFPNSSSYPVPNAPCGVERRGYTCSLTLGRLFLMHRVELKGHNNAYGKPSTLAFLMHRVELKDSLTSSIPPLKTCVPNAPCGVERSL